MNPYLSALVLALLFAVAGFGVLSIIGAASTPNGVWDVVSLGGLAYMTGLAASLIVLIALMCIGVSVSLVLFVALCLLLGVAGALAARLRGTAEAAPSLTRTGRATSQTQRRVAAVLIGLVVAYAYLGARWANVLPLAGSWDAWGMWLRKGYLLYYFGHYPTAFLTSPTFAAGHPNYPMLIPVMNALWFHLAGTSTIAIHIQYWALLIAALWAAAHTAARRSRPAAWLPLIAVLAVIPELRAQLMSLYADIPMALLLLMGVIWLGDWLVHDDAEAGLWLGMLFLAGAANTKDEGMTGGLAVIAAAWVVCLCGRPLKRRVVKLATATVTFGVAVAPWQIWLAVHHIGGDIPVGKSVSPTYVFHRLGRFGPSLSAFAHNTFAANWYFVVPAAGLLTVVCLIAGRARTLAAFFLIAGLADAAAILWVYVIGTDPLKWWLDHSADRTPDGLVFISAAALISLSGQMLPREITLSEILGPLSPQRRLKARVGSDAAQP